MLTVPGQEKAGRALNRACWALNCAGGAQVEKDLANISQAMSNATFARFVKDPCISRKEKGAAMAKAVASADETTRKLAGAPLPAPADAVAVRLSLHQGRTLQGCGLLPPKCLSVCRFFSPCVYLSLCFSPSLYLSLFFSPSILCGVVWTVLLCENGPKVYTVQT